MTVAWQPHLPPGSVPCMLAMYLKFGLASVSPGLSDISNTYSGNLRTCVLAVHGRLVHVRGDELAAQSTAHRCTSKGPHDAPCTVPEAGCQGALQSSGQHSASAA